MDRASGSGVFARDPDALLDLIELSAPPGQTGATAWRVEGRCGSSRSLPVNIWFDYPVHLLDATGCLQDVQPEAELAGCRRASSGQPKDRQKERREALEKAFAACDMENTGCVPLVQLITYLGKSKNTIRITWTNTPVLRGARTVSKGSKKLIEELTPGVKNRGQGQFGKLTRSNRGQNGVRGQFDPSKMVYGGVKNRGQKSIYIIYTFLTALILTVHHRARSERRMR